MRDHIGLDVLANWVCMLRAGIDGAIWLADDDEEAQFYTRCAHARAVVLSAPGLALEVLDAVSSRGIEGVVVTIRRRSVPDHHRENVFWLSAGDVASLLMASRGCMQVILDICGEPWQTACDKAVGSVVCKVIRIARQFAQIRIACLGVYLAAPSLDDLLKLIRWDTFELDSDKLASTLAGISGTDLQQIVDVASCGEIRADLLECDGRDAVYVLAAATSNYRPRGIKARKAMSAEGLLGMLRVGFDMEELEDDDLYWRMKQWERRNHQYPLLAQWRTLDPLGVVLDQRYWERDLARMLRFAGAEGRVAVFELDLDNFKEVNSQLGHVLGDEAIRKFCSIVKRIIGKYGEVYRRGGDEVLVLAHDIDPTRAESLAEEARAEIESEFRRWGEQRGLKAPPTASIGLVIVGGDRDAKELVGMVEKSMQLAKEQGKNRVVLLA